jgi:hypothetical protein
MLEQLSQASYVWRFHLAQHDRLLRHVELDEPIQQPAEQVLDRHAALRASVVQSHLALRR